MNLKTNKPQSAGTLDIGSRSIELVLLEGGRMADWAKLPTTFDPLAQCRRLLQSVHGVPIVATGYGRKLIQENFPDRQVTTITEIQAYALGAHHLCPQARTVLDIGGQDTKAIALTPDGRVAKFEMNDRCAAGTGKFLEFMATALQVELEDFGGFALQADKRIQINSMCTVFAESEATSLMARGETAANIAMGLHLAIVQRTAGHAAPGGADAAARLRRRRGPQPLRPEAPWKKPSRCPSSSRSSPTWWAPWERPYTARAKRGRGEMGKRNGPRLSLLNHFPFLPF